MRLLTALAFLLAPLTLHAECVGQNLITALPPGQRAALLTATNDAPYPRGNLWQADKDGQHITLVGTYHLDDPRHAATLALLAEPLSKASALLVEAGPDEEAALKSFLAAHPERMILQDGPTLPEVLPEEDWLRLSGALRERGIPPFMAAKMQPWYVSTLLSIPACQMAELAAMNGLDRRLMTLAAARGLPVRGLEPFDTIFTIFDSFQVQDQMAMLIQSLDAAAAGDDLAVTLSDSYFAGESRLIWEFTKQYLQTTSDMSPAEVDREFALVEAAMVTRRNHSWIAVIEAAAAQGPVVVAFGALHLSGKEGVLNLLAQNGWTITALTP